MALCCYYEFSNLFWEIFVSKEMNVDLKDEVFDIKCTYCLRRPYLRFVGQIIISPLFIRNSNCDFERNAISLNSPFPVALGVKTV